MRRIVAALALALMSAVASAQSASELTPVAEYVAFIGEADLYNSNGERLSAPWQVLRQDRANYHRHGIRQAGDQGDPLFDDIDNRALMEAYVRDGEISEQAAADIMRGGAIVVVRAYAALPRGQWVEVEILR